MFFNILTSVIKVEGFFYFVDFLDAHKRSLQEWNRFVDVGYRIGPPFQVVESVDDFAGESSLDWLCRISCNNCIRRNIFGDH